MASVKPRGRYWTARIRKPGINLHKTFDTKAEAEAWSAAEEAKIEAGEWKPPSATLTIADLFDRYSREVSPHKGNPEFDTYRLVALAKMLRGPVESCDAARLAEWRDERLKQVSPGSVNRELGLIGAVFTRAIKEWRLPIAVNPVHQIMRPRNPPHRTRRVTDAELAVVVRQLGWDRVSAPETLYQWVAWIACLGLETAMRRGEMLSMTWANVHDRHVHLPKTKNGHARNVPLSSGARALFGLLERGEGQIVPLKPNTFEQYWIRAVKATGIKDLHMHDLRHEATTRMAPKFRDAMELSRVTGHRTLAALQMYYHPDVEDLSRKLD
jgi:integrase